MAAIRVLQLEALQALSQQALLRLALRLHQHQQPHVETLRLLSLTAYRQQLAVRTFDQNLDDALGYYNVDDDHLTDTLASLAPGTLSTDAETKRSLQLLGKRWSLGGVFRSVASVCALVVNHIPLLTYLTLLLLWYRLLRGAWQMFSQLLWSELLRQLLIQ